MATFKGHVPIRSEIVTDYIIL